MRRSFCRDRFFRWSVVPLFSGFLLSVPMSAQSTNVTITSRGPGGFTLLRDGLPYFVRGVGGSSHLEMVVTCGGNSIRTWGAETLEKEQEGKRLVDRAHDLGLTITAGIWIEPARHGFDYTNQKQVEAQRQRIKQTVRKFKDSPALLIWGLGNEMEGNGAQDPLVWKELNILAGIVKEEDQKHPVMTVIAGAREDKIRSVLEHYPNIDVLGVNAYAGASGVGRALKQFGWQKPFMLTEFGPQGHWEVAKTPWKAPIEPTSAEKAASYYATYTLLMESSKESCLGTYVFLWGQKQETTSTWYGMFLEGGEKLPSVDAMARIWTGKWPVNRCPKIQHFTTSLRGNSVRPGEVATASVEASDPEGDPLSYEWSVVAESQDLKEGGDVESVPPSYPECTHGQGSEKATITVPKRPGAYRLFVTVRDGKGGASKDNVPFSVAP